MSKSIKLEDDNYWDSRGITHNKTPLNSLLDNIISNVNKLLGNSKVIWTNTANGVKIHINSIVNDKMPIVILGTDNTSSEPIFILLFANNNSTSTSIIGSKQLSGSSKTITRKGNTYHINASIYSTYWVLVPIGANITVTNASI